LQITNVLPFFLLMAVFFGVGYLFSRALTPYNSLVPQLLTKKGYYLGLESMRGILALSVVVHHAVVWYFLLYNHTSEISGPNATFYSQLGTAPVTFFFFITGFLFWSKLIADPKPRPGIFLAARLRRLGPAYLGGAVFMFALVALFTHFKLQGSPASVAHDAIRVLFGETPHLNGLVFAPWLWGVTWTLQLEVLFYLLIPFLGWFAQTLWKTLLFIASCNLLYGASLAIRPEHFHLPGFFLIQALLRFLSYTFCVGMIAAHLVKIPSIRGFALSFWATPISVALILVTMCLLPPLHGPLESLFLSIPFVAVACGCEFWGALRTRALLFLGQISYSVYLIHLLVYGAILIPLYGVLGPTMRRSTVYWTIILLTGPVIVGIATLWNRTLELPFLGRRRAARSVVPSISGAPTR